MLRTYRVALQVITERITPDEVGSIERSYAQLEQELTAMLNDEVRLRNQLSGSQKSNDDVEADQLRDEIEGSLVS